MELSDEQRYIFDLKGYLVIPGVLDANEQHVLREHFACGGGCFDGPGRDILLDHPVMVDILREFIHEDIDEETYGFRCETGFVSEKVDGYRVGIPHRGAYVQGPSQYNTRYGKIYSGFTRAIWEINEVKAESRGTIFIPGSHKDNFPIPPDIKNCDSSVYESYTCPAGSLIIFCEGLVHDGGLWQTKEHPRLSYLYGYNHYCVQFHKMKESMSHDTIMQMTKRQQSLFRGVWTLHKEEGNKILNNYYSMENRAS